MTTTARTRTAREYLRVSLDRSGRARSVVAPLLDTSDTLAYEMSRYFGLDPRPTIRRTHMHRTALLRRARPSDSPVARASTCTGSSAGCPLCRSPDVTQTGG